MCYITRRGWWCALRLLFRGTPHEAVIRSRDTKPWAKFADFRRAGRLFQFIFVSLQIKVGSINELAMDSRLSCRRCLFSIKERSELRDFGKKQKDTMRAA